MIKKLSIVIVVFVLMTTVASASNPPQAVITCHECDEVSEGRLVVYIDSGSKIVLSSASSQDDIGIVSRIWTKNGVMVSNNIQYSPIVTEKTEFVLTVTDNEEKSDSETVEVRLNYVAPPNNCLPGWKGEILSNNEDDLLVGDEITLDANIESSDCVGYEIEWSTRDDNIVIVNKSLGRTKVKIGKGTAIGKHTIEVVLSNSEKSRDQEIKINVVRNTPPTLVIDYEYPYSYGVLYVDFSESKTGSNERNEYNDYIQRCYVRLDDENGTFVNDGSWNVDRNRKPSSVKVKTVEMGNHSIYVTIEDSHGAISTTRKDIWVQEGNSTRDPLVIEDPDNVTCIIGEECKFSVYQTYQRYKREGISFSYYDMTYPDNPERLANPEGHYLTGPNFRRVFSHSGNFTVKVVATSRGDRSGFKNVNVVVLENKTVESALISSNQTSIPTQPTQTQTLTPTPTQTKLVVVPQSTPYLSESSTVKIPGMEIWIAIIVIIIIVAFMNKKEN